MMPGVISASGMLRTGQLNGSAEMHLHWMATLLMLYKWASCTSLTRNSKKLLSLTHNQNHVFRADLPLSLTRSRKWKWNGAKLCKKVQVVTKIHQNRQCCMMTGQWKNITFEMRFAYIVGSKGNVLVKQCWSRSFVSSDSRTQFISQCYTLGLAPV